MTARIGEQATIKIRQFPDRVELVELHVNFPEGTRAAGHPPLNVAKWAEWADAQGLLYMKYRQLAIDEQEIVEELLGESRQEGVAPYDVEKATEDLMLKLVDLGGDEMKRALVQARQRGRRQRITDEELVEVARFRAKHSASETAAKYSMSVRNVFRWDSLARERGLVEG
jgi:hypothetical protein